MIKFFCSSYRNITVEEQSNGNNDFDTVVQPGEKRTLTMCDEDKESASNPIKIQRF